MNTELLRRILDKARDDAANPSAAMAIEDLLIDVGALETALDRDGIDGPACLSVVCDDFKALCDHARTQPFDVVDNDDGTTSVKELQPGDFAIWIGELERLAQ